MLAAGKPKGALHGVPFTVKDSFDTAGVVSTGGTLGRKEYVPGKDATVVARVRAAGAILLGKTNTPEFTLGGGGKGTVNLVYGLTKNPYNTDYQPSGSSGGAGAIVAAGGAYFDIGSRLWRLDSRSGLRQRHRRPQADLGRVPRTGHIVGYGGPFDYFQETGPMARRVEDIALLMPILAGPDNWDAAMAPVPFGDPAKVDLKKLRVAFYTTNGTDRSDGRDPGRGQANASAYFKQARLQGHGGHAAEDERARRGAAEIQRRRWPRAHAPAAEGTARAGVAGPARRRRPVPSSEFTRLCEEMDAIKSEQLAWFEKYDLIVCPATISAAAFRSTSSHPKGATRARATQLHQRIQHHRLARRSRARRHFGGAEPGLPLGVQLVAQPWRDDVVIAAMALGRKANWWLAAALHLETLTEPQMTTENPPAILSRRRVVWHGRRRGSTLATAAQAASTHRPAARSSTCPRKNSPDSSVRRRSRRSKRPMPTSRARLRSNDKLNAVVMNCFDRALVEAKALDAKAARGEFVGPLHGVPMTIKDSLDTEGVITTGATVGRQQYVPDKDATAVARVRKAGAVC